MPYGKLKNYVNGKWVEPTGAEYLDVEDPSTARIIAQVPLSAEQHVDEAVAAARDAFRGWAQTPVPYRVQHLIKLLELITRQQEPISRLMTEENGKSLPDSRAEMKRLLQNIETAIGMPVLQQGDKLIGAAAGIDGEVLRLPVGVFGMIAPFNFPGMVPFWFAPYALATGNTYVLKPSELVPLTMMKVAECVHEAGFPAGVFNLVNGDKTAAAALIEHPDVAGISFVGSSRVCRLVAERCAQLHKRAQPMGSAKNHLVAMPDAKMDEMIRNMVTSCFGCAGQRCMASSAIVAVGQAMYEQVCKRFVETARQVIVANPLDPKVADEAMVMGPVITAAAKQRICGLIEDGIREGATLALDGRELVVPGCEDGHFIGPTVFTDVKPGMKIHQTEIFGPVVVILKADSLDEAIGIINDHQYGNGGSIYTQNGYWARRFKLEALCGMIGVNIGIPAPVAYLPFGGMKESQFADIKAQGKHIVNFFTEPKIVTERWWPEDR
jgi:malonate-semialdehyde dehydrogenase (acetylating)/methylmalonate-semialdehyde dehydrogenase